ncbi:HNH endonuclease [Ralstonia sp. 3PA37C10]|jgi:hypothetical protein|uniref:HNH endonuclease n=1 Tax=Ralstonia sp. 3PA37C10 TaxID=2502217 RepID=UPI001484F844|nr:HNH endonuclease [Ralstonia sp. 3PA37C10]
MTPPLRPRTAPPVRTLLEDADQNVSAWEFTKDGDPIANPNNNMGRSSMWAFPGKEGEPTVLSIWFDDIDTDVEPAVYVANDRKWRQSIIDQADAQTVGKEKKGRVAQWTERSYRLDVEVQRCFDKRLPIRLILVDGIRRNANTLQEASRVKARSLDPATWYVHAYDDLSGDYRIVRGVEPPAPAAPQVSLPQDLGLEPALLAFLGTLADTERAAIIKARVGQGPFRDALIERWGGCSVTRLPRSEFCIASHIKPWRDCETATERVSAANGLLLIPNLDSLFDGGYISFDEQFKILISPKLGEGFVTALGVHRQMRLGQAAGADNHPFLTWHRERVFRR